MDGAKIFCSEVVDKLTTFALAVFISTLLLRTIIALHDLVTCQAAVKEKLSCGEHVQIDLGLDKEQKLGNSRRSAPFWRKSTYCADCNGRRQKQI